MNVVALIPARGSIGGSPSRNVSLLAGRPLVEYTIKAALDSGIFDKVVVVTEAEHVGSIAKNCGADVHFLSKDVSEHDRVPKVCVDALHGLESEGLKFDAMTILLPVCPLRASEDIKEAWEFFCSSGTEHLMSVCVSPLSPFWALKMDAGCQLENVFDDARFDKTDTEEKIVFHNLGIVMIRTEVFLKNRLYYGPKMVGYQMPKERSIMIKEDSDLRIAKALMGIGRNNLS